MYNFIFIFHGLLAILTQLVIFRELSVLFYGNELFLGTFLSSWLFWVGMGSLWVRRLLLKAQLKVDYFAYGFLTISIFLPLLFLCIRLSKGLFAFGQLIGPLATISYTFLVMSGLCFVIGGQFSLACAIAGDQTKAAGALGRVYLYEALGSVVGGVLFTYILIGTVPTFIVAVILSLISVVVGGKLLHSEKKMSAKNLLLIAVSLAMIAFYFKIEPTVNRLQWRKYTFIQQKESRNATLSLVKLGSIKSVFFDGLLAASFPGAENYEPVAHWPLLAIDTPGRILVLGDTSLGILKEVLKHHPHVLDYVVLDHSFIDFVTDHLDAEDRAALRDARVHIYYQDPRLFVKNSKAQYDAVIMNIPEVPNLKLNRFFTQEFYAQLKVILRPNGILALSVVSSENYLSRQTQMFNASVYQTMRSVFQTAEIIPGESMMLLCSSSAIDIRPETILARFKNRKISNSYVIPSYLEYKLDVHRRADIERLLAETSGIEMNSDFKPTTYHYFSNLWQNKFASPLGYLMGSAFLGMIVFFFFRGKSSPGYFAQRKECVLVFKFGFISILLELLLLFSFQIISGYVYWQMGMLFAAFMLGLFLGSALGGLSRDKKKQTHFLFLIILSVAIVVLTVCARFLIPHLVNLSSHQKMLIFLMCLILAGGLSGAAFVIAGFSIREQDVLMKAGSLYSADLWGAALGAILSANFIIPKFGLLGAFTFAAIAGIFGLVIFLVLSFKRGL